MAAVTISDVAEKAGVSQSTVSLVINKSDRVREGTRKKVEQAIRELGYHPRRQARGLASQRTGNIGFILMERYKTTNEPFYTRIFLGAEFEASNLDYYLLLTSVKERFSEETDIPRFLIEKNVDGILVSGRNPKPLLKYIQKLGIPTVYIDYFVHGLTENAILIDNEHGGFSATKHLLEQGCRRIAFCGGSSRHPSIQGRYRGYLEAIYSEVGLEESDLRNQGLVYLEPEETCPPLGYEACGQLLEAGEPPDGIFAVNDGTAIGCLRRLRNEGFRVPEDVMLIGFDDVEWVRHVDPPLSSVKVQKDQMGAMGVQMLVNLLDSTHSVQIPHKRVLPTRVMVRESTGGHSEDDSEKYF